MNPEGGGQSPIPESPISCVMHEYEVHAAFVMLIYVRVIPGITGVSCWHLVMIKKIKKKKKKPVFVGLGVGTWSTHACVVRLCMLPHCTHFATYVYRFELVLNKMHNSS